MGTGVREVTCLHRLRQGHDGMSRLNMPTTVRFVDASNTSRRKALVFVSTRVA